MFYALCSIPSGPSRFGAFIHPVTMKRVRMLRLRVASKIVLSAPITGSQEGFWLFMRKEGFAPEDLDCLDAPAYTPAGGLIAMEDNYQVVAWNYRAGTWD